MTKPTTATGTASQEAAGKRAQLAQRRDRRELLRDAAVASARALGAEYACWIEVQEGDDDMAVTLLHVESGRRRQSLLALDEGTSIAAFALKRGASVELTDLRQETRFHDELLTGAGIQSGIVQPLTELDQPLGGLAVFFTQPREFTLDDAQQLELVGELVKATLLARQAIAPRYAASDIGSALFRATDALILVADQRRRIKRVNSAFTRATGYTDRELENRPLAESLFHSESLAALENALGQLETSDGPARVECEVLTRSGQRRRVAWCFSNTDGERGPGDLLATGIDVTDRQQALEQLREASCEAQTARAEVKRLRQMLSTSSVAINDFDGLRKDRRRAERTSFPYDQSLAPCDGDQLPAADDFAKIRCRDISAKGFSYIVNRPPEFKQAIVAFGTEPKLIHMRVEIIHVSYLPELDAGKYLVGCHFLGKVQLP